jgi:hypothetical protein
MIAFKASRTGLMIAFMASRTGLMIAFKDMRPFNRERMTARTEDDTNPDLVERHGGLIPAIRPASHSPFWHSALCILLFVGPGSKFHVELFSFRSTDTLTEEQFHGS